MLKLKEKEPQMNVRNYIKPSFAAMFPTEIEILHDGEGAVMVILPKGIVTICGTKEVL